MRCPKCGYISFDHLASCKKCNKDISGAAEELDGVVFDASPPLFLVFEHGEHGTEPQGDGSLVVDENMEEAVDFSLEEDGAEIDDEIVMDLDADVDADADEAGEELILAGDEEGLSLDFDDFEAATPDGEITLDFDDDEKTVAASKEEGLPLDFGEIDISDLAPPDEDTEELVTESLSLDEEVAPEVALAGGAPAAPVSVAPGAGLEDLQVEDLDLDVAAPLVAGSKAGDKLMPSVKTGTALDDFEIDLGDLINDEK
jgi:hypothetical protein